MPLCVQSVTKLNKAYSKGFKKSTSSKIKNTAGFGTLKRVAGKLLATLTGRALQERKNVSSPLPPLLVTLCSLSPLLVTLSPLPPLLVTSSSLPPLLVTSCSLPFCAALSCVGLLPGAARMGCSLPSYVTLPIYHCTIASLYD